MGANPPSTAERILRLQDEWDELSATPEKVELTDAQRAELDDRLEEHAGAPDDVVSWEQVKREVRTKP